MMHRRPPRAAIIGAVAILAIAAYYGIRAITARGNGALKASGTVEAVIVDIAAELPGQVREVLVEEGQQVATGDTLLTLDDSLLRQQRKGAAAALESAQAASLTAKSALEIARAQYQQSLESALARGRQSRLSDWFAADQVQFNQPEWYFSRGEQIQAVQLQVDKARKEWETAEARIDTLAQSLAQADFLEAEQRLLAARVDYLIRKDVNERAQNSTDQDAPQGRFNRTHCGTNEGYLLSDRRLTNIIYRCSGDEHLSAVSERLLDEAEAELEEAQRAYDQLLTTAVADEMLSARAEVVVAQERYYAALDRLSALQTSDHDPSVTAAQGVVDQAQAANQQSLKQVAQAQAALDLIDAQLQKLTLRAPMAGTVLTRAVEPGEYLQPGAVALSLGDLSRITITVYVPEDRYGQISQGQEAVVTADSFPRLTFQANVVQIGNDAEFTPRNVQTVEGRSATVYAVKLSITNPEGKLKPGMPADVHFK